MTTAKSSRVRVEKSFEGDLCGGIVGICGVSRDDKGRTYRLKTVRSTRYAKDGIKSPQQTSSITEHTRETGYQLSNDIDA